MNSKNPDIFTLVDEHGRLFHPTRQAATFAKYSRSPLSARVLIQRTDELNAKKFQEKYLLGTQHNAIGELATAPIAFEGVSIIASKMLESWQRPGVCEKSTRMQEFGHESLCIPEGIDPQLLETTLPLVYQAFELYQRILVELPKEVKATRPELTKNQIKRLVFDTARYLLPAGVRTSLGICAYPRDISSMIAELQGSANSELVSIGKDLKTAALELGGPLIRNTEPDTWVHTHPVPTLTRRTKPLAANQVWLASHYPLEEHLLGDIKERYALTIAQLGIIMEQRPPHHATPKLLRMGRLSYDILIDYGAYRDLQRHRRMEQVVEPLTTCYGYAIPSGLRMLSNTLWYEYVELLVKFRALNWPTEPQKQLLAQYLVPLAFLVGWHIDLDLEQLYYLVELRTQEEGHTSYRGVAWDILYAAQKVYPQLTQWVRPRGPDPRA